MSSKEILDRVLKEINLSLKERSINEFFDKFKLGTSVNLVDDVGTEGMLVGENSPFYLVVWSKDKDIKKPVKNYRGKKWVERQLILKGLK